MISSRKDRTERISPFPFNHGLKVFIWPDKFLDRKQNKSQILQIWSYHQQVDEWILRRIPLGMFIVTEGYRGVSFCIFSALHLNKRYFITLVRNIFRKLQNSYILLTSNPSHKHTYWSDCTSGLNLFSTKPITLALRKRRA